MTIGWNPSPGGGGAVDSVFTRTGVVVAAIGDYTSEQITDPTFGDVKIACEQLDALALTVDDKADSDSPTFTGNVNGSGAATFSVPTVSYPNNTTAAASTAFVTAALAARAPLTGTGSATWANNTQVVWSETLAEGQWLGGTFTISVGHNVAGTLYATAGFATFTARRAVGGSAVVVTAISPTEGGGAGPLAAGTMAVTVSGNDVQVTLLYPSLAGTAYFAWSLQRLVPPVV